MDSLIELFQSGESETLEFKETWGEATLKTIAAFANTRGGILLVGVDNRGQATGWQGADRELQAIVNQIADGLRIQPQITVESLEGHPVLRVQGTPSAVPIAYQGRYYRRVGNTTREISLDELGRFFVARLGVKWDGIPEACSLEELDEETLRRFVQMAQARLPYLSAQEPTESLLRKLELLEDGRPTRGAMLLFGVNPQRYFLMAEIHMGRFKDGITIVDDKLLKGNLFQQLDGAMQTFRQYLQVRYEMPKEIGERAGAEALQRREIWDYPLEALREAVINALIHRDYFQTSGDIQIRVYDDRVMISNPGGLPEDMTVEELKREFHRSVLRNRRHLSCHENLLR